MKTPSEFQIEKLFGQVTDELMHVDAAAAAYQRAYYLRNRKLKGRKQGGVEDSSRKTIGDFWTAASTRNNNGTDPRTGKTVKQIHKEAVAKQRKELTVRVKNLEQRLVKLDALIRKKESAKASENRKAVADKNTAAKERDDPKTAAEKAEVARENKKYRDKNQAKLKSKTNTTDSKSSGSSSGKSSSSGASVSDLRSLATKVKGQIAVAKQKLAAL